MRNYSIGVFLNIFNNNIDDWRQQMDFIGGLDGVEHIEVLLEYLPQTEAEKKLLLSFLNKYRVIIHAPFMYIAILSPHAEIVLASEKILKKTIIFAHELNAEVMTMHAERYPNFNSNTTAMEQVLKCLKKLAADAKFPICVENLSYCGNLQIAYPASPQDLINLAKKNLPMTGITLDTGHLLKDGYELYSLIRSLRKAIFNIHLHGGRKGGAHLSLGTGDLDLEKLLSVLKEINYGNFLSLEVVGQENIKNSWNLLRNASTGAAENS